MLATDKPNIIFLVLDQLRPDRLAHFEEFAALRKQGVFVGNVITYAPYTVASLHALLTGMNGTRNGVDSYYGSLDFDTEHCFTLAQYLREQGYYTRADVLSQIVLPHQGFDEVSVHDEHKDDLCALHQSLIAQAPGKKPFFLFLHYSNIHTGIITQVVNRFTDTDDAYFGRFEENRARYDGFVKGAAGYVNGIMAHCRQKGLTDDTLFVILTDHGCSLGEKPGEKCYGVFTYDYTVRTFAYFLYPRALPRDMQVDLQVRSIDIAPTVLDLLGVSPKQGYKEMQGASLLPMIRGTDRRDRDAYIETAGLSGPFPSPYKPNICAMRTPRWKLIRNEANGTRELYDLKNDPFETNNVAGSHPDIESALDAKIRQEDGRALLKE